MKRREQKLWNEIYQFLMCNVIVEREWKGYIGEVKIEAKRIAENIIINCFCCNSQYIRIVSTRGELVRHQIVFAGRKLSKLNWFLLQLKTKR